MMRPAFGFTKRVERRESNQQEIGRGGNEVHLQRSLYAVMVTTLFVFWVPIWTSETEWSL